jgi:hypothetical protein
MTLIDRGTRPAFAVKGGICQRAKENTASRSSTLWQAMSGLLRESKGADRARESGGGYGSANEKSPASLLGFLNSGSPTWTRTRDLRINSPSLYQLSYQGKEAVL